MRARWIALDARTWLEDGALAISGGRIIACHARAAELARRVDARSTVDFGDALVAPGLVDAHAHLELSGLTDVTAQGSFADWIRALIATRASRTADDLARDARAGADRLLATGTTLVGDIDATGAGDVGLAGHPIRRRVYREALDAGDPARDTAVLEALARSRVRRARDAFGISPHAPYTVSAPLADALGTLARSRRAWLAIHWAETREEVEWLTVGVGPLAALLRESPHTSGLECIERAGLLGPRTALVHGNLPEPGDYERAARAGATLVHCPGAHAYFARDAFDFDACRRAGLRLALGTDGRSSNTDLDMRREMSLARRVAPHVDPADVFEAATSAAAAALGNAGRAGVLHPGAWADFAVHRAAGALDARAWLEALTSGGTAVSEVWIAGARAYPRSSERSRLGPSA